VALMGARERLMAYPAVYAAWQAPFAAQKFAPVERALRAHDVRRVLDVGCGTGTNADRFRDADYVGVDINERYLEVARTRFRGTFVNADLTQAHLPSLGAFDTILVNSFLHHLDDADVVKILQQLREVLLPDGRVHILELVLPERKSPAWVMARLDRGRYARPVGRWNVLFSAAFEPVVVEPYFFGGGLWSMIYFQGRAKS
jgi:SAM-dependent methyltransferase